MAGPGRYIGEYRATLDGEGRIQLPVALRDELNVRREDLRLMANLEPDGSICLREREHWESYVAQLRDRPARGLRSRRTLLFLAANSAPVKCDRQGRVRIPDSLLAHAGLERGRTGRRELVLVGNFEDLRAWSPARWGAFVEEALADYGGALDAILADTQSH